MYLTTLLLTIGIPLAIWNYKLGNYKTSTFIVFALGTLITASLCNN